MSATQYDTLSDRRDLQELLANPKLTDKLRLEFVSTIISQANLQMTTRAVAAPNGEYTYQEARLDLLALVFQYGVDLGKIMQQLENLIRKLR